MALGPRYCQVCGGPLRVQQVIDHERLVCSRCGEVAYLDAKVAASTITLLNKEQVVLVRRSINPGYGLWVLPGGFIERGETVPEGAIRETREEVGLEVEVDRLIGVFSYPQTVVVVVIYEAHPVGGELFASSPECMEVRAFRPQEIPWDHLAFHSTRDGLKQWQLLFNVPPSRECGS